jgi:ABC-type multidrug transport system fused ATPase/permease subunit
MTVTAVIILVVTHLDMNMTKIPGFGIELAHGAPKSRILLFLVGFFLYFTAAFVVKFIAERGAITLPRKSLQSLESGLKRRIENLASHQQSSLVENVKGLTNTLQYAVDEFKEQTFTKHDHLLGASDERWATFDNTSAREEQLAALHMLPDDPPNNEKWQQIRGAWTERNLRARKIGDAVYEQNIEKLNAAAAAHLHNVRLYLADFETRFRAQIEHVQKEIAAQAADVHAMNANIKRIRRELRSLARALTWNNIILGFALPLVFSLGAFAYSLPQALVDMSPIAEANCLPPLRWECYYRDPTPGPLARVKDVLDQALGVLR